MGKKFDNLKKAEASQLQPSHKDGKPMPESNSLFPTDEFYPDSSELEISVKEVLELQRKIEIVHGGLLRRMSEWC